MPVEKSEELKAQTGFGKVSENEHYSVRHLETDYQNNYEFDLNPSFILFQVEVSNCVDYERRCDNKSKIQYEKDEADQQFAQINDSELLEECWDSWEFNDFVVVFFESRLRGEHCSEGLGSDVEPFMDGGDDITKVVDFHGFQTSF